MEPVKQNWHSIEVAIEKLPEESPQAYQAFLQFTRYFGPERTCDHVAETLGYQAQSVRNWSSEFNWAERATFIDAQRWLRDEQNRQELAQKDNQEFVNKNREIKQKSIKIANKMLDAGNKLIDDLLLSGEVRETGKVITHDGREVNTVTTIHMKTKASDIPRLVDTGVKIARLAAELPTEIVTDIAARIPSNADLKNLSLEELLEMREQNRSELAKKGAIQNIGGTM